MAQKPEPARVAIRQVKRGLKFTVGKETTYITGPLDSDGYLDYETALNARIGKGITPENNANVLLWKALRPEPKRTPMPPEFFQWLKVPAPPERGEYFVDLIRYANQDLKFKPGGPMDELRKQRGWAAQRPWAEKDYPGIASWPKANEKPLAVGIAASRRPDYYNPLVSRKYGEEGWYGLIGALLPGAAECYREVAPALAARAMLYAGKGRFEEAWQDLLACHRLGGLLARGADYNEFQLGVGIHQIAGDAELALLDRASPTAKQARIWLGDLEHLPPIPAVADKVDLGVRFTFLNTVMMARRAPIKTLRLIEILEGRARPQSLTGLQEPQQALVDSLDWDSLLRAGNEWYDRVLAAQRAKDRVSREKEFKQIEDELKALGKDAGAPADLIKALREGGDSGKEVSKKLAYVLIDYSRLLIRRMQRSADLAEQAQRNLHLAFALAVYRGDHGRYPEKLDALAPGYLKEVPNDLFSGKAMLYRPSENKYLLYSVGVNGLDEGGNGFDDLPPGDDVCVRMPLPELKRK